METPDNAAVLRDEGVANSGIVNIIGEKGLTVERRVNPALDDFPRVVLPGREVLQNGAPRIATLCCPVPYGFSVWRHVIEKVPCGHVIRMCLRRPI